MAAQHNQVDQFVKEVLRESFEGLGITSPELEVGAAAQRIDFYFAPSAETSPEAWLGVPPLLARLGQTPCIVEHYHAPPGTDAVRDCLRKQLTLHHRRRKKEASPEMAVLWVLSSGRPRLLMRGFAFERLGGWPRGVYRGPLRAVPYRLIVLRELPEVRDTLALRLLGRGRTFSRALNELAALPLDAWERVHMTPLLLQYRVPTQPETIAAFKEDGAEKEIVMTSQECLKQLTERAVKQERAQERALAFQGFAHLFERHLSRPLTEAERTTVRERYDTVGPARLADVTVDLQPEELTAWLSNPNAK